MINNLNDVKKTFKKIKTPIFGAVSYASERLGPEQFVDNYKLVSLYDSKETDLIAKDIPVFCLEKVVGERLSPRNASTTLTNKETQRHFKKESKGKQPMVLLYKSSKRIENEVAKKRFKIACPSCKFGKNLFENKAKFRRILDNLNISAPPGKVVPLSFLKFRKLGELFEIFGRPLVIQHPQKGGGKGTFFVRDENDYARTKYILRKDPPKEIVISKFIEGPSPSITGCVTKYGILSTLPQYQIIDEHLLNRNFVGSGLFCGHDWSSANFSKNILCQAEDAVNKIGNFFKTQGYKGIFGLDFVLDEKDEKLHVVECNPRLLASFPTLTMVQIANGEIPIIAFHLLEYLGVNYKINIKKINEQMWQKKEGAQMFFHSPLNKKVMLKKFFEAGVYKFGQGNLDFVRSGYQFSDIKKSNEFLFTDGIQKQRVPYNPLQRVRIVCKKGVLGRDFRGVNLETKKFLRTVINQIKKNCI
jgi:hypothetical protein